MNRDESWTIAGNGKNDWHCSGHDFGESLSNPIRLAHLDGPGRHPRFVVFQVPGGTHWTGNGTPRERHPAMYRVIEITKLVMHGADSPNHIHGRLVVEFPVITKWSES